MTTTTTTTDTSTSTSTTSTTSTSTTTETSTSTTSSTTTASTTTTTSTTTVTPEITAPPDSVLPANIFDRILDPSSHNTSSAEESGLWNRLWFYPGRPPQSAELNEIQTLIINKLNRLGQTLFKEGSRISGIEIIVKAGNRVQVTNGVMFIDGAPRDIDGTPSFPTLQDLQLTGSGREFVSLLRIEETIRPENDISLLNPVLAPTVGVVPFNRKGALRQIFRYQWVVVNDLNPNPAAVPVFEFRDGNLITTQSTGQFTELLRVLARRTLDANGHFLVNGFVVNVSPDNANQDKLILRIDAGKAYVGGYEILKTVPSVFSIDKAVTTASVNGEAFVFKTTPTPIRVYSLASTPVKRVIDVAAKVLRSYTQSSNGVQVVRSTTEDFDDLFSPTQVTPDLSPDSANKGIAIYQILKITNVPSTPSLPVSPSYLQGVDYELSGNTIQWISGNRPGPGQSYYVDLVLIRSLTKGRRIKKTITDEVVNHAASGGTDDLSQKDIVRIIKVASLQNSSTPDYLESRDYYVKSGRTSTAISFGGVDWSPSGSGSVEPSVGAPYYVTYEYWEHVIGQEGDYVSRDSYFNEDNITPAGNNLDSYQYGTVDLGVSNSVDFRVVGGDTPVDGLDVAVDYEYFLQRRDSISLSSDGGFVIHTGVPARYPQYPAISSSALHIASIDLPANSSNVLITYPETRRFTFQDIWQIKDTLDVQVYNAAIKYLETLAQFEFTSGYKKMILVDPFIDFSRSDFTFSRNNVVYDASINPENGYVGLSELYGTRRLRPYSQQFVTNNFRKTAIASYTEESLIDQSYATEKVALNPFTVLDPVATIRLTPNEWFQPDLVTTPDYRPEARVDSLLPLTQDDLRIESGRKTRVFGLVRGAINRFWAGGRKVVPWGGTGQLNKVTNIFTASNTVSLVASDNIVSSRAMDRVDQYLIDRSVVPQLDQITVQVESSNWRPFADNIRVTFDGVEVAMTPISVGFQGTIAGTLRADANGTWSGSFLIPIKSASGRRQVVASSLVPGTTDTIISASAVFSGEGLRQIDNTSFVSLIPVNTTTEDLNSQFIRTAPVSQTFFSKRNAWLTGVTLFFGKIPVAGGSEDHPLLIQIRDVDQDGFPGPNILTSVTVKSSNIGTAVSLDSSVPFNATFDDPVFMQEGSEYCLVLDTESADYSIFLSRLGYNDYLTSQKVTKNTYVGTLWRSAGGRAWTQDQYGSLKFKIRSAVFDVNTKSVIVFQNILDINNTQLLRNNYGEVNIPKTPGTQSQLPNKYRKFCHIVSSYSPPGSRMTWYYSVNAGTSWTPYTPGVEVELAQVPSQLQIKVEMDMQITSSSDGSQLPAASAALNIDHNGLILMANAASGSQITKNVNIPQVCNNLRVAFVTNVPVSNTSPNQRLAVYISTNGGFNWTQLPSFTEQILSAPYREWRFDSAVAPYNQLQIRIDITNSTDAASDPKIFALRVIGY